MPRNSDSIKGVPFSPRSGRGIYNLDEQFNRQQFGQWPDSNYPNSSWIRPSDWPSLTNLATTDNKFSGLLAVTNDESNFVALNATMTNASVPSFASLTSGSDSTDSATYTTASVTLAAGTLYLFSIENSHGTNASLVSSITSTNSYGLPNFVQNATTQFNSNLNGVTLFSVVPTATWTGTLTINFGGTTQTGACWSLIEVLNAGTLAGTNGIVQAVTATGNSGTASVTLASLGLSTNSTFGVQAHAAATASTPNASYTEVHDVTASSPAQALQTQYKVVGSTTVDATFTSAEWGMIGVEIARRYYTVDWGDGVTEKIVSGAQAQHQYTYSTLNTVVTFRGYKTALVNITANDSWTTFTLQVKHSQASLNTYNAQWLDIAIAGFNLTTITIGATTETVRLRLLEQVNIVSSNLISYNSQFNNLNKLQNVSVNSNAPVISHSSLIASGQISTTDASSYTTNSVTLKPGFLYVLGVQNNHGTNATAISSITSSTAGVPAFTEVATQQFNSNLNRVSIWSVVPTSLWTGTLTINFNNVTQTGCAWVVSQFIKASGIVQAVTSTGSSSTGSVSMATPSNINNLMYGIFSQNQSTTHTPGSGYSEIVDLSAGSPPQSFTAVFRNTASAIVNCTFTGSSAWGGIGLEIAYDITDNSNNATVTTITSMFSGCYSLESVPLFNTANVTDMTSMFNSCFSLQTVPLFNTQNVINMSQMFISCYSLQSVPLFNTANVTTMNTMFGNCFSLQTVSLFNTQNVTNMTSMFNSCYFLQTVPLFNTANVTNMTSMFSSCSSLQTVSLFNTANVTDMTSMFNSCYSLQTVPLFNTQNVINMSQMFISCSSLQSVPLFNTANVTTMTSMFSGCYSLQSIPSLNASKMATTTSGNMSSIFGSCNSLSSSGLQNATRGHSYTICNLSKNALETIMDNLGSAWSSPGYATQTLTISSNWGAPTPISLSGTTTSGSTTVTMASTSGLSTGMEISGTGISDAVNCTVQQSTNTFTRNAHGFVNGDSIGLIALNGAGGGILNKSFYVVEKTDNTFKVSDTLNGNAKTITATPKFVGTTSGSNDADASTYTTASVTLTAGRLYLLTVENSHGTAATAISSITGDAGVPTFTSRRTNTFGTVNRLTVLSAAPSSNYTGTLTINFGGTTQTGALWTLVEVMNVDTTTNDGIVTSNEAVNNSGSASSLAVNATVLSQSTNAFFAASARNMTASTNGGTNGSRFTEIYDITAATPAQSLQISYLSDVNDFYDLYISLNWSGTSNAALFYFEIKTGTVVADADASIIYPTTITAITPNTNITLSMPATASGTITTSSALLKRSKARMKGWTVSG